ncbi:MAG TPA: hypothetical protein VGK64_09080 [Bryobacteraceae bacterium]
MPDPHDASGDRGACRNPTFERSSIGVISLALIESPAATLASFDALS